MSIDTRENAEAVAAFLNDALVTAPDAVRALMAASVPVDVDACEDAPIVVARGPDGDWRLRPIGLINGLFSANHRVAEVYVDGAPDRIARFVVLDLTVPREERAGEAATP